MKIAPSPRCLLCEKVIDGAVILWPLVKTRHPRHVARANRGVRGRYLQLCAPCAGPLLGSVCDVTVTTVTTVEVKAA